jgi:hypothetical protein
MGATHPLPLPFGKGYRLAKIGQRMAGPGRVAMIEEIMS